MKCEEVELLMIDYLDNALEKSQQDEIEKHLQKCDRCIDVMKDFKQIINKIDEAEPEQPDDSLRVNFYHMLHGEINKQTISKAPSTNGGKLINKSSIIFRIAAGIAILIAGITIGIIFQGSLKNRDNEAQLTELKTEVQNMKELVMLSMLKEESSSQRIQAVSYVEEFPAPDKKVLDALTSTLNNDKNVNVRLAAAYSLSKYADKQWVRDSLVESLTKQTEPIIQVVLINILVEKRETKAINAIRQIIYDDATLKDVKDVAEKGIQHLL